MLSRGRIQLIIIASAALLFIPGLGAVHLFDWDEINFAEIAREMLVTGDRLQPRIDYLPFHEKPPLFIWLQAFSMSAFGVGEFAARLPNAICGIVTLLVLFRIGERSRGRTFGLLWALAYVGSILPHLYFRSGIIDPWFNLFIFLGLDAFISTVREEHPSQTGLAYRSALLTGLFLGLAVMTKGPVGVLIPGITIVVYWTTTGFKRIVGVRTLLTAALACAATVGLWGVIDLLRNGPDFMVGFFWRQVAMLTSEDAGHGGFFGYHFVVLLLGCFPASLFALRELLQRTRSEQVVQNDHRRWMVILFWVVLLLFSVVKTKIVHYSSLCYFPLTYLAAIQLERSWRNKEGFGWPRSAVGAIGMVLVVIMVAVPILGRNIELVHPFVQNDAFARANLDAAVTWSGREIIAGVLLLVALLTAHLLHGRKNFRASILVLFCGTSLFVTTTLYFFIDRIEGYSQRAAIEFFQARHGEDCYVITKNYKSYAQLFYTGKQSVKDPRSHDEEWLLYGDMDKPVYVVCKITSAEEVGAIRTLKELYRKNGFIFYKRDP